MKTLKKTLILSDKRLSRKPQMVLTLENKNGSTFGYLKSHTNEYMDNLLLGIKNGREIIKQNIKFVSNMCQFKLQSTLDLDDEVSCAMVDISNGFNPILWGSSKGESQKPTILANLRTHINKLSSRHENVEVSAISNATSLASSNDVVSKSQTAFKDSRIDITPQSKPTLKDCEDVAMANVSSIPQVDLVSDDKAKLFESSEDEINNIIDGNIHLEHEFYNLISDQLDELFSRYPREENLEALIDKSKWCKIDSDIDGRYYVVGLIYNDDDIKYICYGVPGSYDVEPPQELRGYSQWLPTDTTNPYTIGYWVMYQDADTGENVLIN